MGTFRGRAAPTVASTAGVARHVVKLRAAEIVRVISLSVTFLTVLTAMASAQDQPVNPDINVAFSAEDFVSGYLLAAITMIIHGFGMLATLRTCDTYGHWVRRRRSFYTGIGSLIIASWMIFTVHILEVVVWAFFVRSIRAIPDLSDAFYFSILQYTTVGSRFTLPFQWRSLEGGLAMTGLLTFAWSTAVLMTIVDKFQAGQLRNRSRRRQ